MELRASGYPRPKKESGRELDDSPSEDEDDEEGMLDDELIKEEKKVEDLDVENPEEEKGLQPDNESEEDDEDSDGEETWLCRVVTTESQDGIMLMRPLHRQFIPVC